MDRFLALSFLLNQLDYGYNPEYENLSEEEKAYLDYVDECLKDNDPKFCNACTEAMLFLLDAASKLGTEEELTEEEALSQKKQLLAPFNQNDQERLEYFMYACVQTMGIYSEERIAERKQNKTLIRTDTSKEQLL